MKTNKILWKFFLKKNCFHHKGLECKSNKTSDTWSNSGFGLMSTNEGEQSWTENLFLKIHWSVNTLFHPTSNDSLHEHHHMVNIKSDGIYLCGWSWRSYYIQSAKTRPNWHLLAQIMSSCLQNSGIKLESKKNH